MVLIIRAYERIFARTALLSPLFRHCRGGARHHALLSQWGETEFPEGYAFLLRAGDTAGSVGLVLSGSVLVIQEDIWGNRNILSRAGPGQTFAAAFACAPG